MQTIAVYGTYLGQEKLAWIGRADRLYLFFKEERLGFLTRKGDKSSFGWDNDYIPVVR